MTAGSAAVDPGRLRASVGSVVVGVDLHSSSAALFWAAMEATRRRLPLHLLHGVAADGRSHGWNAREPAQEVPSTEGVLDAAVARTRRLAPSLALRAELRDESAADALVAASRSADTVVLGARRRGPLAAAVLGSVSARVAAQAECPSSW
jgi:nucleotide-binding universal stress UspA family protein